MKIKYFMFGGQDFNGGVTKKIFSQVLELSQLGLNVELVLVSVGDVHYPPYDFLTVYKVNSVPMGDFFGRIKRAREISRIFGKVVDSLSPSDVLYYRYSGSFPLYYPKTYFRRIRACKIVTEHQTKELDELKLTDNVLSYWSDFFFGKLLRKQSDAIIGVTDEITQYEITRARDPEKPHLTIGNGFSVQFVPVRGAPDYTDNELHLLCVANVSRWHGLDRLLRGLSTYSGTPKVILHIAGVGAELPHLQQLTKEIGISDWVVFHGFTTGKALDVLFDQCHVAVGSLGIHRIGLNEASILKAREYCARGIPFIYGTPDPDFPADFSYVLHLPADESPIDIERVLAFAKKVCADPEHPQKMRRYAEEHLDWSVKMKKLKDFLETLVGEDRIEGVPKPSAALITATRQRGAAIATVTGADPETCLQNCHENRDVEP